MSEPVEAVVAESSPAIATEPVKPQVDPLQEGPMGAWTREQRNEFRNTGKMPEKPKADPAPAKKPSEAPAESAAASEAANQQESTEQPHKKTQTAAERISQLEKAIETEWEKDDPDLVRIAQFNATIDKIGGKRQRKTEIAPVPETAKPKPVDAPQPIYTRPKPKPDGLNRDGKPYETYEDYVEDLADWSGEQKVAQFQQRQQQEAMARELAAKVAEAKARYPNYDEVIDPAVDAILGDRDVNGVVKAMLNDSEVLPDLMFTIGSKPEELASFIKMARETPGKALRYIALTESLIREELENAKSGASEKVAVTPAKPQTQAPKPPAEVGGRGSAPPDALVAAAAANDFRSFKAELNRRSLARLKTG